MHKTVRSLSGLLTKWNIAMGLSLAKSPLGSALILSAMLTFIYMSLLLTKSALYREECVFDLWSMTGSCGLIQFMIPGL
jgi:hypothetical protein